MITCRNCGHQFHGNFCNSCGQSSHTHDINIHYVVHEIQHGIIHIDRGFFFTIKELFTRPGNSIREYIEGKRVDHFKPLAFLLIISTVYAFLSHSLDVRTYLESVVLGSKSVPDKDGSKPISYVVFDWLVTHYAYSSLLLLPISALASYVSFIKSKYNYFQHLVLNAFISGQVTLFNIFYIILMYFVNRNDPFYESDIIQVIAGFLLTLWTYLQFFEDMSTVKKLLLTALNYILLVIFITVAMLISIAIPSLLMKK